MSKNKRNRLPPMGNSPRELVGVQALGVQVVSWCPDREAAAKPTAVAIVATTPIHGDIVIRLKSPDAVDSVIQALLRHKRDVWPTSP